MALEKTRDRWWGRMAFGLIALVFGLAFLLVPGFTLTLFLYLFGFFMILSGIVLIGFSRYRPKGSAHRKLNLLEGGIDIVIGVVAFLAPGLTALWIVYLVAAFAILSGILQIAESVIAPRGTTSFGASNRWILFVSGIWSLLIGVLIVLFPEGGILAILWIIGLFLIIVGVINIVTGLRMRTAATPTATQ